MFIAGMTGVAEPPVNDIRTGPGRWICSKNG
jgi:hypothetical protein